MEKRHEQLGQYHKIQRKIEAIAILVYLGSITYLTYLLIPFAIIHPFLILSALLGGMFLADMGTGLLHWAGDTWGTPNWPIVGSTFIRPFREHHINQKAITQHDFIETNGSNSLFSLPITGCGLYLYYTSSNSTGLFITSLLTSTAIFGFLTNQFHKWAHTDTPPKIVKFLQRKRLILNPHHHNIHHTPPFEHYYAITNGWTNWIARKVHFYRILEWIITKLTRETPRKSDQEIIS